MPSMPSVPLIRARPSLACSVIGAIPAAAAAAAAIALADQREGDVGERGEVATRPERAVLRDRRGDAALSRSTSRSTTTGRTPGVPHRQRARPQQHHRPHDLVLDGRAHPGGVGAEQGAL